VKIGIRKIGLIASAVAIGGTGAGLALGSTPAHAQAAASFSVASAALDSFGNANVSFSVTCAVKDAGTIRATVSQATAQSSFSNVFTCTGSPQTVVVQASISGGFAPGQVLVGASLDVQPAGIGGGTPPFGNLAALVVIVPIG
jgi:hypothetical protein